MVRSILARALLIGCCTAVPAFLTSGASPSTEAGRRAAKVEINGWREALIYSKTGKPTPKSELIDGRWNLSKAEDKLGLKITDLQKKQLMACVGEITCLDIGGKGYSTATALVVMRSDMIAVSRHLLGPKDKYRADLHRCSFATYSNKMKHIDVLFDKNDIHTLGQRAITVRDFWVAKLSERVYDCIPFVLPKKSQETQLLVGQQVVNVTASQVGVLNPVTNLEPLVARGEVKVAEGALDPSFYHGDIDLDHGGSGGGIFAIDGEGRLETDEFGRLVLFATAQYVAGHDRDGDPYQDLDGRRSDEENAKRQNYTGFLGTDGEFRNLILRHERELIAADSCKRLRSYSESILRYFEPLARDFHTAKNCSRDNFEISQYVSLFLKLQTDLDNRLRSKSCIAKSANGTKSDQYQKEVDDFHKECASEIRAFMIPAPKLEPNEFGLINQPLDVFFEHTRADFEPPTTAGCNLAIDLFNHSVKETNELIKRWNGLTSPAHCDEERRRLLKDLAGGIEKRGEIGVWGRCGYESSADAEDKAKHNLKLRDQLKELAKQCEAKAR